MKFYVLLLSACISTVAAGGTKKEDISACVENKLSAYRTQEPMQVKDGVTCVAGVLHGLNCKKEDKDQEVKYTVKDGFKIVAASAQKTSKTERGNVGSLSWNAKEASVPVSCRGNGCDKGDREWAEAQIDGTIERIPTDEDRKAVLDKCLDEVL